MLLPSNTVFVAACVAFLLSSVSGAHSYSQLSSHARRTQAIRYSIAKRQGSFKGLGGNLDGIVQGAPHTLGDVLDGTINNPRPENDDSNPQSDGPQPGHSSLVPSHGSVDALASPSATPTSPSNSASTTEPSNSPSTGASQARGPPENHPAPTSAEGGLLDDLGSVIDTLTNVGGGNDHPTAVPSKSPTPSEHAHEPIPTTILVAPSSTVLSAPSTGPSNPDSTPPPSSSATSSSGGGILDPLTTLLGPVLGSPSSAQDSSSGSPSSQSRPATSPTPMPSQGGVLDPITSIIGPVLGSPAESGGTESNASPSSTFASDSNSLPQPTTSQGGVLDPVTSILGPVLGPPNHNPPSTSASGSTVQSPPTTTSAPPTSQGGILDPVTSILGPVLGPPASPSPSPSSMSVSGSNIQSQLPTSSTSQDGILDPVTSILDPVTSILGPVLSTPAQSSESRPTTTPPTPATSQDGIPDPITSLLSTILNPQPTDTYHPTATNSDSTTLPGTSLPSIIPTTPTPGNTSNSGVPQPTVSLPLSESSSGSTTPIISFPTATTTSLNSSITEATSTRGSILTSAATTVSVQSDLSFVLTASSLAFASIQSSSIVQTLTDPDQATTTFETIPTPATTVVMPASLPTGMPARIFPRDQLDPNTDLSGFTLISILFNNELNWRFVVGNPLASSQIFAYVPVLVMTALSITSDQVKTYALQVYIPSSYHGPSDADELGTMWLGYIPSDLVDTLAAQIKVKSSPFYTGVPDGVPKDLANRVNSGFPLLSVVDPNQESGSVGSNDQNNSSTNLDDGTSRRDAIIGVVSALGAIALFVLVFLVYRSMKRRRQLAHRRLSDPPDDVIGVRPAGRQFDQDSVGGARRRSFYFAEDSLRGFEQQQEQQIMAEASTSNNLMQRRNVAPGSISAPVLKGSTLNW